MELVMLYTNDDVKLYGREDGGPYKFYGQMLVGGDVSHTFEENGWQTTLSELEGLYGFTPGSVDESNPLFARGEIAQLLVHLAGAFPDELLKDVTDVEARLQAAAEALKATVPAPVPGPAPPPSDNGSGSWGWLALLAIPALMVVLD